MINETFETQRLKINPWRGELSQPKFRGQLKKILSTKVTTHLPPALQDVTDIDKWIDERNAESNVFSVTESGVCIGLLILAESEKGQVHLGYLFDEAAWGKGFASELLTGLVAATPEKTTLLGGVSLENPASARVLEKAGFVIDNTLSSAEHVIYTKTIN